MDTESAACCGQSGYHVICGTPAEGTSCGDGQWADPEGQVDPESIVGRFVAIPEAMTIQDSVAYCAEHFSGIASIHSNLEQRHAVTACEKFADGSGTPDPSTGVVAPSGCWIGLQDEAVEGGFVWYDSSPVDFVAWAPGRPNNYVNPETGVGENAVELDVRNGISGGEWNDASIESFFPVCQTQPAPPPPPGAVAPSMVWGTGTTASFRVQVCVGECDNHPRLQNRIVFQSLTH
jgi:hypothetical protein